MKKQLITFAVLFALLSFYLPAQEIGLNVGLGKTFFGRATTLNHTYYYSQINELNQERSVNTSSFGEGINFGLEAGIKWGHSGLYFSPFLNYLHSSPVSSILMLKGSNEDYRSEVTFYSRTIILGLLMGHITHLGNTALLYQAGFQNMAGYHYKTLNQVGEVFNPKSLKVTDRYSASFNPGFLLRFMAIQKFDESMSLGLSLEYRNQNFTPRKRETIEYLENASSKINELSDFERYSEFHNYVNEPLDLNFEEKTTNGPNQEPAFSITHNVLMLKAHILFHL